MSAKNERDTRGIYPLQNGTFRVKVALGDRKRGGQQREKTFPKGTALRKMQAWRDDTRALLRRTSLRPARGTLADGVERYLLLPEVKALAAYKDRQREIRSWLPTFGHLHRHLITAEKVRKRLNDWRYPEDPK